MWGEPRLRTLWLGFVGLVICGYGFQTLLPGLLHQELGRSPTDIGVIFLALAVAGLVINLPLAAIVSTPLGLARTHRLGAIMALGFLLLSIAPTYGLIIAAGIPLGAGRSGFMLVDNALLMSTTKPAYSDRVMSLAMMGYGTQALLAPFWGILADTIGVRQTLVIVGIATATVTALVGLSWQRNRTAELSPSSDDASKAINAGEETFPV